MRLKLPVKRLNVIGDRYRIQFKRMPEYGKVHYRTGLIEIRPSQSEDQARDTLLHEVIHVIDAVDSLQMSEEQVRRVATGLRAVFTANPEFGKWVCK